MAYLVIFILFTLFGCYNLTEQYRHYKESQAYLYFISFIILVFFAGLRYHTGADWPNYEYHFNYINPKLDRFFDDNRTYYDPVGFEMGYVYLTSLVKTLGGGITTVFFIIVFFNIAGIFLLIRKYSPYPFVAILGFFSYTYIQYNFAGVRQALAFFFLALSIKHLQNRNFWMYAFYIVIGYFFHSSLIVFIPLYFLPLHKKTNVKFAVFALSVAFIINLVFPISKIIPMLSQIGVLPSFMNDKLLSYLNRDDYGKARGAGVGLLLKLLILLAGLKYRKYLREHTPHFDFIFNVFCVYFFVWMITNSFEVLVARYSLYFQVFQDILLSYFLLVVPAKKAQRVAIFLILLVSINFYFMSGLYRGTVRDEYNPYRNYLFYRWPIVSN